MLPALLLLTTPLLSQADPAAVAAAEARLGWRTLFDGRSLAGWHPFGKPGAAPEGWSVADGTLHLPAGAGGGDLVSDASFGDFELEFEWKVASGGNSGVKVRFRDERALGRVLGPEYQLLDDATHPDAARPETSAASLYALYPPLDKPPAPAGEWQRARIVARGDRLEHWLNGKRVLVAEVGSPDWETRRLASKFSSDEDFGRARPSPFALQDHGDPVWFRNLRARDPSLPEAETRALFDGKTLAGWKLVGAGEVMVEAGELVGRGGNGKGFLVYERPLGDFVLELELENDAPANSGIQIRSRLEKGLVFGYQIEVDPSERAWSGGLYEEGGAWLQTLEHDAEARAAFRPGEWNHYRIECAGPLIRAFVNGVPTCDYRTANPTPGVLALQLHDPATRMRWRELRLFEPSAR
jgi:3-keto-disaccharide hydrolase